MGKLRNFNSKKHRIYKPLNMNKFKGDSYPICRSSWEFSFCKYLDRNNSVLEWSSESIVINYQDPCYSIYNGKIKSRRYYPDFFVKMINMDNRIIKYLIEIKPYKETIQPKKTSRKSTKTLLYEAKTWKTNNAKWKAAKRYCSQRNWVFKILTEKELF